MKRQLGVFLAALILTGGVNAFAYGHDGHKAGWLKDKLALTDEQVTQVEAIYKNNEPDKEALKARKEKIENEISAVLTDAQKAQYADLLAKKQELLAKRDEKMKQYESFVNSLTPEQKAQFQELHKGFGGRGGFCEKH